MPFPGGQYGHIKAAADQACQPYAIVDVEVHRPFIFTVTCSYGWPLWHCLLSMVIFGVDDMLIFRVKGEESQIMQITKDDIIWRYVAAFGYAAIAPHRDRSNCDPAVDLRENSIGPIVATVCIVIVFTVVSNINVPIIDKNVKPWLFTSYLVGWKGFFI